MSNLTTDDRAAIIEVAKRCPRDYPPGGLESDENCLLLRDMLLRAGFPHAAKAVLGGFAWARQLTFATVEDVEKDASDTGWSWNKSQPERDQ